MSVRPAGTRGRGLNCETARHVSQHQVSPSQPELEGLEEEEEEAGEEVCLFFPNIFTSAVFKVINITARSIGTKGKTCFCWLNFNLKKNCVWFSFLFVTFSLHACKLFFILVVYCSTFCVRSKVRHGIQRSDSGDGGGGAMMSDSLPCRRPYHRQLQMQPSPFQQIASGTLTRCNRS